MTFLNKKTLWLVLAAVAVVALPALAHAQETIGIAKPWQLGFQQAVTPGKERMEWFHNSLLMPVITGIVIFVTALLLYVVLRFNAKTNPVPSKTTHNTMLEVIWTLVPVLILVVIVIPSMKMLYFLDRTKEAEMTLKVTGYQWYWGYEYPDQGGVNFLSNMVQDKDLKEGEPRLLKTDNAVVLPVDTNIRILITASDVIHSWAVPAFGVKTDAVPGRTNETWTRIEKEGIYYGQCSELCGQNHGYMPIEIHAVSKADFAKWVVAQGGTMTAPAATTAPTDPAAKAEAKADAKEAAEASTDKDAAKDRAEKVKDEAEKVDAAVQKDPLIDSVPPSSDKK